MNDYRFRTDRVRLARLGIGRYRLDTYDVENDVWLRSAYLECCDTDTAVHLAELLDADRRIAHDPEPVAA